MMRLVIAAALPALSRQRAVVPRYRGQRAFHMSSRDMVPDANRWSAHLVDGSDAADRVPITVVNKASWGPWLYSQDDKTKAWLKALGRDKWKAGAWAVVPHPETGALARVVVTVRNVSTLYALSDLPGKLPADAVYDLELLGSEQPARDATRAALSWALGCYSFHQLRSSRSPTFARLAWPEGADRPSVLAAADATYLCRDLITMPCEQLGPAELEAAVRALADRVGSAASVSSIVGEDLLKGNFPVIHAVGRAAAVGREPRLIDLRWGRADAPKLTIVGKGVCFDTGGLDIKPSAAMLTMKKDMGGSAHAMALASLVMSTGLDVRLRLLIPAVENAISGSAMRPGDVLSHRNGRSTEVGNTDAEGRLILSDALVAASEEDPDLIVDMATLTGASRVALGTDVPSVFSTRAELARHLQDLSTTVADPVWHLPLHEPYREQLKSSVADLKNVGKGPYGGAITAALYLSEFVGPRALRDRAAAPADKGDADEEDEDEDAAGDRGIQGPDWLHLDIMAFNTASRPGRPEGGEAMGVRAVFALLCERYGTPGGPPPCI